MNVCFVLSFSLAQKGKSIKNNKNKNNVQKHHFHIPRISVVNTLGFGFFLAAAASPPGEADVDFLKEVKRQSEKLSTRSWVPVKGKRTGGSEMGQTGRECELKSLCCCWREWPFVMTEAKERAGSAFVESLRVDGMPVSVTCTCVTLWRDSLSLRAEVLLIRLAARTGSYSAGGAAEEQDSPENSNTNAILIGN